MGVVEEEDFHGWVVDGSGTRSGAMGSPRLLLCDSPPQGLETTAYASCGSEGPLGLAGASLPPRCFMTVTGASVI